MSVRNLEALLQPASVALVGASDRAGSIGCVVLRNLKSGGFKGPIWPVNHKHDAVDGQRAWRDIASLPQAPDLALICTPAPAVPALVAALGAKGTRAVIVISAGLRQTVFAGGPSLEQAMLDAARPGLMRVLGPNCIGALVPGIGLNASFAPGNALPGSLAFVTQSGALATTMLDWANGRGIGFSHFVSLGDSADVDFGDLLDYLASDAGTRAILMYVESIKDARKFMSAARSAARNKPVIVVKAGRAPEGAKAAASHTGALAGSDVVFDAAIRRAGMLRVDTLEDLFDAAETLAHARPLRGERLAILTNGGGAGVLAADALSLSGGQLAVLGEPTLDALSRCLPANWSHGNPVDIIGDAPVARYADALRVLLGAPEVDAVLFMHAPTAVVPAGEIASACLPSMRQADKPVLACWLGGAAVASARAACSGGGISCYDTPERAISAWLQSVTYARNQDALGQLPIGLAADYAPDRARALELLSQALAQGRDWLDVMDVQALLDAYGIASPPTRLADSVDEAVRQAAQLGFPVALKIVSPQIIHKSDVGGVALGLSSEHAVRAAALAMLDNTARLAPQASVRGFLLQPMVKRSGARELIAGIATDPVFGPVLLFGEGGTSVELRAGHAVALPPLNDSLARDLVWRSRCTPLLAAFRGHAGVHEEALLGLLRKVSQIACDLAAVAELDINPLLADERGVLALDARVRLRRPAPAESRRLAICPYPYALEERVRLSGSELVLRPIRPEDGARLKDFYAGVSPADMRLRFFMARREVPHSELARYSQIDYDREMTFIALAHPESGSPDMAGEVRSVCDPDNHRAEFAIQVAASWQGRGLGRLLLAKLVSYLRERGTAEVAGECLLENQAMAGLARATGFEVRVSLAHNVMSMRLPLR